MVFLNLMSFACQLEAGSQDYIAKCSLPNMIYSTHLHLHIQALLLRSVSRPSGSDISILAWLILGHTRFGSMLRHCQGREKEYTN